MTEIIIPALAGFISGTIGSLIAPWVQWAIEKRRSRMNNRRELVNQWRINIESFDFQNRNFGETAFYSAMREHLQVEIKKKLEKPRTYHIIDSARGQNFKKQVLLDEVARLEKKWNLV